MLPLAATAALVLFWGAFTWALHRWNVRTPHEGQEWRERLLPQLESYELAAPGILYNDGMLTSDSDWAGLI